MDVLFAELFIKALHGTFWRIVVLTQVTEHNMLDFRMIHLRNKSCRLLVAEVAEASADAVLQFRGIRPVAEHQRIIIGLDHEGIRLGGEFHCLRSHPAAIRDDHEPVAVNPDGYPLTGSAVYDEDISKYLKFLQQGLLRFTSKEEGRRRKE